MKLESKYYEFHFQDKPSNSQIRTFFIKNKQQVFHKIDIFLYIQFIFLWMFQNATASWLTVLSFFFCLPPLLRTLYIFLFATKQGLFLLF